MAATSVTYSSITVQWGPVNCSQHNGDITGYSVRYGVQGYDTQTMNVSGDATKTTIPELNSSTVYVIEVAAVNSAGTGPYSDPITETTDGKFSCMFYNPLYWGASAPTFPSFIYNNVLFLLNRCIFSITLKGKRDMFYICGKLLLL